MFETLEHDRNRYRWKENIKSEIVRRYDSAFTGGDLGKEYLIKLGMPEDRIRKGYDSVDNDYYQKMSEMVRGESNTHRPTREKQFIAVGRFIKKKNYDGLLRGYRKYKDIVGERCWRLLIIGDGPEYVKLTKLTESLGIYNDVNIRRYGDIEYVARYLAESDVLIMPSNKEEQWGLVINEAMASGLPVIATNVCGATSELVIPNETGYIIEAGSDAAITEGLLRAHENADGLIAMGKQAQVHVDKCSLSNFSRNFYECANIAWMHRNA